MRDKDRQSNTWDAFVARAARRRQSCSAQKHPAQLREVSLASKAVPQADQGPNAQHVCLLDLDESTVKKLPLLKQN